MGTLAIVKPSDEKNLTFIALGANEQRGVWAFQPHLLGQFRESTCRGGLAKYASQQEPGKLIPPRV